MLSEIIDATNLTSEFCANLVGASKDHFDEWVTGKRPVPRFLLPELVSIFGATREQIRGLSPFRSSAIWFKLRSDNKCNTSDLEMVGMTRKLCFHVGQLYSLLGLNAVKYKVVFEKARIAAARFESPEEQGRAAARAIRNELDWEHGKCGIGELIRPNLRNIGLVVVESPFRDAMVEGCSFCTEGPESAVICLFVNSYQITWFRRNAVLLHELCHAMFDMGDASASVDYKADNDPEASEVRAQAFACECLVPREVLVHFQNQHGIDWRSLTPRDLARLIALCHAPQHLILKAALDYGILTSVEFVRYSQFECSALLQEFTTHGLTTKEYAETLPVGEKKWVLANRAVSIGDRKLVLPPAYIESVIRALNDGKITLGKAAELALMDSEDFQSRFAEFILSQE